MFNVNANPKNTLKYGTCLIWGHLNGIIMEHAGISFSTFKSQRGDDDQSAYCYSKILVRYAPFLTKGKIMWGYSLQNSEE